VSRHFRNLLVLPLLAQLIFFLGVPTAIAKVVKLPITIDYPLLQNLIINKAFREQNESVVLINEGGGCIYLILSHPKVAEEKGFIRLETEVMVRAGTPLGGECLMPIAWRGYLVLYQRPVINNQTWQLSFKNYRSGIFERNRQPAHVPGILWQLIESQVFNYLNSITIDLAPPVNDLKSFLFPLFPPQVQDQTRAMLDTLRTGEPEITPEAVTLQILADVQEVYRPEDARFTEALSDKELEEVVAVWEQWDALLSFLVAAMAKDILTPEERRTLMDVLLETRYNFVENLGNQSVTHDFVRVQFANAWKQLSPIFRNHLHPDASPQKLGFLSFFTAADALTALDSLGPTFGVEVSRNGLVRLAKTISNDPAVLRYSPGVNPDLQRIFEMDAAPMQAPDQGEPPPNEEILEKDLLSTPQPEAEVEPAPAQTPAPEVESSPEGEILEKDLPLTPQPEPEVDPAPTPAPEVESAPGVEQSPEGEILEKDLPVSPQPKPEPVPEVEPESAPEPESSPLSRFINFFCTPVYAVERADSKEIQRWRIPETGLDSYVEKVVRLLKAQAQTTLKQKNVPTSIHSTFRLMIPAMAWQESCFRQFVMRNNQLTYLLSYNNSSVGLMQVNTRVWRGLYDAERLRWDIRYNAAAGCEIAALYLKDYALRDRKGGERPDNETVAQLVYAMYNGGPGQYKKFLERKRSGNLYKSDKLFLEKYEWVTTASWDKISKCLGGG
jgi:hypothetical protein